MAEVINEDTGLPPECPFCGSPGECQVHLVGCFDMTFGECNNGALWSQISSFEEAISKAFAAAFSKHTIAKWANTDIQNLWDQSFAGFDPDDALPYLETRPFFDLLRSTLIGAGAIEYRGPLIEDTGPGLSSLIRMLFAEDPDEAVNRAYTDICRALAL